MEKEREIKVYMPLFYGWGRALRRVGRHLTGHRLLYAGIAAASLAKCLGADADTVQQVATVFYAGLAVRSH